jgi:hypothetical protein
MRLFRHPERIKNNGNWSLKLLMPIQYVSAVDVAEAAVRLLPHNIKEVDERKYRYKALTALPYVEKTSGTMAPTLCCIGCAALDPSMLGSEYRQMMHIHSEELDKMRKE